MSADEDLSERIDDILRAQHKEMSPETCATVRQRACDGKTPTEIAHDNDINWAEATVRQHARGHCNHDIKHEPITPYNTRHAALTPAECAHIRRQRALGIRASYIAERMDCDENTVYTHENGDCSHESEGTAEGESA